MERLRRADLQALLVGVQELHSCHSHEMYPAAAVTLLRGLIPGVRHAYIEADVRRKQARVVVVNPADALLPGMAELAARYAHEHPLVVHRREMRGGRSHAISDFVSRRQFERTGTYDALYRPIGARDQLSLELPAPHGWLIGIGINRDRVGFTARERLIFDLLGPHLIAAYDTARTLRTVHAAIDASEQAMLALDNDGHVRWATDRGWRAIRAYFPESRQSGALPSTLAAWVRQQQGALSAADDAPTPPTPLIMEHDDNRLIVRVVPGDRAGADTLLVMQESRHLSPEMLTPLGLSPREREVLCGIVRGEADAQIARTLGMSTRTVQKHLEHIYAKLGVESRAAATARVFALLHEP